MKKNLILLILILNINVTFSYQTKLIDTIQFDKIELPINSYFLNANIDNFGNYYICATNTIENKNKSLVLKTNDLLNWETVIDSNTIILDTNNIPIDKNNYFSFQEIFIFDSKEIFIRSIEGNYLFSPDYGQTWFLKNIDSELGKKFPDKLINSTISFNENGVGFAILSFVQSDPKNNIAKDSLFFYKTNNGGESWINIQDSTLNITNINNRYNFQFLKVTNEDDFILQVNSYYDKNVDSIVYKPSWFLGNDMGVTWTFLDDFKNNFFNEIKVQYNFINNFDSFNITDIKLIENNKVLIFSQIYNQDKFTPKYPELNQKYPLLIELDLADFKNLKILMLDTNFFFSDIEFVQNYKNKTIVFRNSLLDYHLSIIDDENNIEDRFFDDNVEDNPTGLTSTLLFNNKLILTASFYKELYVIYFDNYTSIEDEIIINPNFLIFPNPTSDKVSVDLGVVAVADLSIYDILGNEIMSIPNYTNKSEIDISTIPIGTYTIQIQTPTGSVSQRMLVNR